MSKRNHAQRSLPAGDVEDEVVVLEHYDPIGKRWVTGFFDPAKAREKRAQGWRNPDPGRNKENLSSRP